MGFSYNSFYSDSHQLLISRVDFGHCFLSTPVGRSCRNPQEPLPLQKCQADGDVWEFSSYKYDIPGEAHITKNLIK